MKKLRKCILLTSSISFVLLYSFSTCSAIQNKPRVAILSFDNLSKALNDPQLETLTGGMCESLIAGMSNIGSIILVERGQINKVLQEQALGLSGAIDESTAPRVGKLLGANTVVLGSFQVIGGQIRITARFVDTETGVIDQAKAQMVTGRWTDDVFSLQDQLASKFLESFGVSAASDEKQRMTAIFQSTDSYTAYDYYIRGREEFLRGSMESAEKAIELYRKALGIDNNYALALAGSGEAYTFIGHQREQCEQTYQYYYDQSIEFSKRAISIDSNLGVAHTALANAYCNIGKHEEGKREALKAIEINPNDGMAYYVLGNTTPDLNERERLFLKAIELNPNIVRAYSDLYMNVYRKRKDWDKGRDWDKALDILKKGLKVEPNHLDLNINLGNMYGFWLVDNKKAKEQCLRCIRILENNPTENRPGVLEKLKKDLRRFIEAGY